ncbi:14521_t:CDS:1, partial [Acaulospora colombiana]
MANIPSLSIFSARLLPTADEVRHGKHIINELNNQIKNSQKGTEGLQRQRDIYASYISPFRRLPTEILNEILEILLNKGMKITRITQI